MKLLCIPVTAMRENVYVYYNEETKNAIVVDPGDTGTKVLDKIKELELNVIGILLTHAHFDHILGLAQIKDFSNAPIIMHTDETPILNFSISHYGDQVNKLGTIKIDKEISEGFEFKLDHITLKAISTPGHTPGGCCYYDEANKILFTGDTLFKESIGRTDFELGNFEDIEKSILNKLYTLPKETRVFCGHGPDTSIGHEIKHNAIIRG